MTADRNRRAARAVANHAPGTPGERREMLDALGLLDGTGRGIVPEPKFRPASMDELTGPTLSAAVGGERDSGRYQDDKIRPRDLSHVPAGLRDYVAPATPAPRKRSPRRRNVLHDGQSDQPGAA